MELDLSGRTVTQALSFVEAAVADCTDEELIIRVDNEVVKLNLYNHIHKSGMVCRLERKGTVFLLHIKVPRRKQGRKQGAPRATAFPVGHLTGKTDAASASTEGTTAPTSRTRRKRSSAKPTAPPARPIPAPAQPAPRTPAKPAPVKTRKDKKHPIQPPKPPPEPPPKAWLVIQQDQIGQKDVALGQELLEDLLDNLNSSRLKGLFLIHRGVRLLDPGYMEGRLLQCLLRTRLPIKACARSLAYYHLMDFVDDEKIDIVPAHELSRLQAGSPLEWI